jgi:hypothetical protein
MNYTKMAEILRVAFNHSNVAAEQAGIPHNEYRKHELRTFFSATN